MIFYYEWNGEQTATMIKGSRLLPLVVCLVGLASVLCGRLDALLVAVITISLSSLGYLAHVYLFAKALQHQSVPP